jgi:hypothetical protein
VPFLCLFCANVVLVLCFCVFYFVHVLWTFCAVFVPFLCSFCAVLCRRCADVVPSLFNHFQRILLSSYIYIMFLCHFCAYFCAYSVPILCVFCAISMLFGLKIIIFSEIFISSENLCLLCASLCSCLCQVVCAYSVLSPHQCIYRSLFVCPSE